MPDLAIPPETRDAYLRTVRDETSRLERIVADLLELSRMENDASALAPRVFAIERAFDHVMSRHARDAAAADVRLSKHIVEQADQLWADPDRIEQVIGNPTPQAVSSHDGTAGPAGSSTATG